MKYKMKSDYVYYSTRRSRFSWSKEERIVLFRLIKKYGQAKFTNNHIRINWNNVCKQSR